MEETKAKFNFTTWKWEKEFKLGEKEMVASNKKPSKKYRGQKEVEEAVFHLYLEKK